MTESKKRAGIPQDVIITIQNLYVKHISIGMNWGEEMQRQKQYASKVLLIFFSSKEYVVKDNNDILKATSNLHFEPFRSSN